MNLNLGAIAAFGEKLAAQEGWRLRGLSFLLGAVLALSFAPFGLFFLPFVVLPIIILILDQQPGRHGGFVVGWWFGFGHFLAGLFWLGYSFLAQSEVPAWAAPRIGRGKDNRPTGTQIRDFGCRPAAHKAIKGASAWG